jgi:N,N'-diacetylchitobiose transport system permease protein
MIATSVFAFITAWNDYIFASTLFSLPVVVFFMLIQRKLVSGMTAGAVKG